MGYVIFISFFKLLNDEAGFIQKLNLDVLKVYRINVIGNIAKCS